ncbi:MAG TPA: hypothetical protein VF783_18800, partial [Terriglobales bacterium]
YRTDLFDSCGSIRFNRPHYAVRHGYRRLVDNVTSRISIDLCPAVVLPAAWYRAGAGLGQPV